ncbi:hypothetical protein GFS03_04590 [Sulfolobus sp. E5-1-F]|uniref:hypothetical protein n=1 Tax=Saccharolobus sp. E5-1-F TaxID=2663019 RepID=UPI001296A8F6|nr:hypothetical protein [Sulfolobus sp. E5-1-F]QGA53903.1 hypothetical protein GFS03_04590 [Sulfolobus sp. E5-1-F]
MTGSSGSQNKRVHIVSEDTYGPKFVEYLIDVLKSKGLIPHNIVPCKSRSTNGKGNFKNVAIWRRIKGIIRSGICDKAIILIDGDGKDIKEVKEEYNLDKLTKELSEDVKEKICTVIFDHEIEEWILPNSNEPSEELKRKEDYDKSDLPKYANEIDIELLKQKSRSFNDFLNCINDP